MTWGIVAISVAVGMFVASGSLISNRKWRFIAVLPLVTGAALLTLGNDGIVAEAKFDGYTSITPEPAIYNVMFIHELSKDEILVAVHIDSSSYKRVFQLKKEWILDKSIPPAPEYLTVSEGDEGQLILLLR